MKCLLLVLAVSGSVALAAESPDSTSVPNFTYQTGLVQLGSGLAEMDVGDGFKYLDPSLSSYVLEKLWGNPPGNQTLGMVFPAGMEPTDSSSWAVVIQYEEDGYVKDKDANKINYSKLLKDMQKATKQENKDRVKNGYEAIELVGWAEQPYYDNVEKKLYWAKELKFGSSPVNTLNYDIRILGRKGHLVLKAVSTMDYLDSIKPYIPELVRSARFQKGNTYAEFDPKIDKVATYGIAGLVAGGLLVKAGLFKALIAGIIALKKLLIVGAIAVAAAIKGLLGKKKEARRKIEEKTRTL
jgi:uncharacterized membrane-anchored protein